MKPSIKKINIGPDERDIKKYLYDQVKKVGGEVYKFEKNRSMPDRLCILPGGAKWFIEVKAPNKRPTKNQLYRIERLKKLQCFAIWIDSKEQVDELLRLWKELNDK